MAEFPVFPLVSAVSSFFFPRGEDLRPLEKWGKWDKNGYFIPFCPNTHTGYVYAYQEIDGSAAIGKRPCPGIWNMVEYGRRAKQ